MAHTSHTRPEPLPGRLDDLLLARLATMKRPPARSSLAQALRPYAPTTFDDAHWSAAIDGSLHRLLAVKQIDDRLRVTATPASIARGLGGGGPLRWKRVIERSVPALALGIPADDARSHARLKDRDQWAAATVARAIGLWKDGPPPGLAAVCDALVWRALHLPGNAKRTPPEVRAYFVRQILPTASGTPARMVHMLAARETGAPRADLRALREALARRWLCGLEWTTTTRQTSSNNEFAAAVRDAANRATDGVFGGRKVFISSVWHALKGDPTFAGLSLPDFKQQLVTAHKAGLVALARADLTAAMDAAAVRESEIAHLEARYHFIERGGAS